MLSAFCGFSQLRQRMNSCAATEAMTPSAAITNGNAAASSAAFCPLTLTLTPSEMAETSAPT